MGQGSDEYHKSPMPHCTGAKEDDREKFITDLGDVTAEQGRLHRERQRRRMNSSAATNLSEEQKKAFKLHPQDLRGMYERLPSMMKNRGEDCRIPSEAYTWFSEITQRAGQWAPRLDVGDQWAVSRPVESTDEEGVLSSEYRIKGVSLEGLAGTDGKESSMYKWALRKFVIELNKRFPMRGTKEKRGMLRVAQNQKANQDGDNFVEVCRRQHGKSRLVEEF
ncbi:hypothetical protein CYMTET_50261 [Cymbomonas tetramitiformis]|uniref:Uncharacterized protein n=1 Tax=Cymbomonas tetramitiformis TaxID=36881 RepID=A0AAE0EUY0_9CHLO|nr:hypothetical protein CYMTET_50261 [Cymbomonas tetramitiformis]